MGSFIETVNDTNTFLNAYDDDEGDGEVIVENDTGESTNNDPKEPNLDKSGTGEQFDF